jgi:hypothetical protein
MEVPTVRYLAVSSAIVQHTLIEASLGVLLVVIIVIGVGILAALIFGIVFVLRKRREQTRVGTASQQQP